jgi:hypothetical protein
MSSAVETVSSQGKSNVQRCPCPLHASTSLFRKASDSCSAWKEKPDIFQNSVEWLLIATFQKCQLQRDYEIESFKGMFRLVEPSEASFGFFFPPTVKDLDFPLGKNYLFQKSFH